MRLAVRPFALTGEALCIPAVNGVAFRARNW